MTLALILILGGVGALARYELGGWVQRAADRPHPTGTLVVNVVGSTLLGLVHALPRIGPTALQLAASGFLGGFTTFSTWMFETVRIGEEAGSGGMVSAAWNLVSMMIGGLLGVLIGTLLAESIG